jgi:hypothetical protein
MSQHPLNLALRFALELAMLAALGVWGWTQHVGMWRVVLAVGLPLVAAALWGVFRVPGDPGNAPVRVSGPLRLALEAALFVAATAALVAAERWTAAAIFGLLTVLHYLASYDRLAWLMRQ